MAYAWKCRRCHKVLRYLAPETVQCECGARIWDSIDFPEWIEPEAEAVYLLPSGPWPAFLAGVAFGAGAMIVVWLITFPFR